MIKAIKRFFGWPVRAYRYFQSDQWQIDKLPYRWWFSNQGKAAVVIVFLAILGLHQAGNPDNFHVILGALIMRILTFPRFY